MAGAGLYEKSRKPLGDVVEDLNQDIAFLQSLSYPDYSRAIVYPPATVALYLGPYTKVKGVIDDVSIEYRKPYTPDLRPMRAEVSFRVTHVTEYPPDYADVRNLNSVDRFEGTKTGTLIVRGSESTSVNRTSSNRTNIPVNSN